MQDFEFPMLGLKWILQIKLFAYLTPYIEVKKKRDLANGAPFRSSAAATFSVLPQSSILRALCKVHHPPCCCYRTRAGGPLIDFLPRPPGHPRCYLLELTPKQQARVDKVTLPLLHAREARMPEPSTQR